MVIDTSAVLAILLNEDGAEAIEQAIDSDPIRLMSAASVLESAIIVEARFGEPGGREFDLFLHKAGIEVVSVTPEQVDVARRAYRDFGKGRHPAGLNFGDCFSYALSKTSGEPLLFKGVDFARSDVSAVL